MSTHKHIDKICLVATIFSLILCAVFMSGEALGIQMASKEMGYEDRLFDTTKVHTIDIVIDDWDAFLETAQSEEYSVCSVVIDGETISNVGIRGKGNTSLNTVSRLDSERYSFKIEFDQYDSSKSYHGLDKLSLNNLIQDATMMKDYLTYVMMNEFGVAAPLCSYAYITVNGEPWGLYLAVEAVEEAFLQRNYGKDFGELYKPDSMGFGGGRGNGKDFSMEDFMDGDKFADVPVQSEQGMQTPPMPNMGDFQVPQMQGGFGRMGGFGGMASADVKLQYVDDNPESYTNIWSNAKTDISQADKTRLIDSLKQLSKGQRINTVVDTEQVLRYFVVHNYVCNGDSYTGTMVHNYYLYEKDGMLAMIPWDYNLAFGTFQGSNAQNTVNTPIDTPISGGSGEDRPMWNWILSNRYYTEQYHQYFLEFLSTVDISSIIDNAYDLIKPYVEKNPTAFYTYEEFETGLDVLRQFCAMRSESISMQLANGETTSNMNYVDASELSLSEMGSMGGIGGFGSFHARTDSRDSFERQTPIEGDIEKAFNPTQMPENFSSISPDRSANTAETAPFDSSGAANSTETGMHPPHGNMQSPEKHFGMSNIDNTASVGTTLILLAISVLFLAMGLVIAKLYKH